MGLGMMMGTQLFPQFFTLSSMQVYILLAPLACLLFPTLSAQSHGAFTQNERILFVDTGAHESYRYQTFFELCRANGLEISYKSFVDIADRSLTSEELRSYKSVIFSLSEEFLRGVISKSRTLSTQFTLKLIKFFGNLKEKTITLLFPETLSNKGLSLGNAFLHMLGAGPNETTQKFSRLSEVLFSNPLEKRKSSFHTPLKIPTESAHRPFFSKHEDVLQASFLPLQSSEESIGLIGELTPYATYCYNEKNQNHILYSYNTLVKLNGINASKHINPLQNEKKIALLETLGNFVLDIKQLMVQSTPIAGYGAKERVTLGEPLIPRSLLFSHKSSHRASSKTGWFTLDMGIFGKKDAAESDKRHQRELVSSIFDAQLSKIWLTIGSDYFSDARRADWLRGLSAFTKLLREVGTSRQQSIPIVVGALEILYGYEGAHGPISCQVNEDIYGNSYTEIPHQLDRVFWDGYIIPRGKQFITDWNTVSNGVQLGGVLLDMEHYHGPFRSFPTVSLFEKKAAQEFATQAALSPEITKSSRLFISTLIRNKLLGSYLLFLKQKSFELGKYIREALGTIEIYQPDIETSWFYSSFYKGVTEPGKKLKFYSFLNSILPFSRWLSEHSLALSHETVFLLSKTRNKTEAARIYRELQEQNDGLWINKFSHIGSSEPEDLTEKLEWSPLSSGEMKSFLEETVAA